MKRIYTIFLGSDVDFLAFGLNPSHIDNTVGVKCIISFDFLLAEVVGYIVEISWA